LAHPIYYTESNRPYLLLRRYQATLGWRAAPSRMYRKNGFRDERKKAPRGILRA
jgi:hypothetical protein